MSFIPVGRQLPRSPPILEGGNIGVDSNLSTPIRKRRPLQDITTTIENKQPSQAEPPVKRQQTSNANYMGGSNEAVRILPSTPVRQPGEKLARTPPGSTVIAIRVNGERLARTPIKTLEFSTTDDVVPTGREAPLVEDMPIRVTTLLSGMQEHHGLKVPVSKPLLS